MACWVVELADLLRNYNLGAAFTREDGKYHEGFDKKHSVGAQWPKPPVVW